MSDTLRKAEIFVSGLLTLMVIWLHVIAATSAGALWRDEANTIGLVTLPSVGDVWKNLQYDSFPLLWLLVLRAFSNAVGPMNDGAFRVLGFFVGVGIVGMLWVIARQLGHEVPLVSLALLGICPSLITWGDSVRAYGFGILLMLVTCALMLRFVERPGAGRLAALALGSVASVQALYYNSVVLLALCAAGAAIFARRRDWRSAGEVVVVGVVAAVSMVPYISTMRGASSWNSLVRIPEYTFALFWVKLHEALRPSGYWTLIIWVELFAVTVVAGLYAFRSKARRDLSQKQNDAILFCLVMMVVGIAALYLFLYILSYVTRPWYYLSLLALTGTCIDGLTGALMRGPTRRVIRLAAVLLFACATVFPATRAVRNRLTNIDIVAARIQSLSSPGDVVVVAQWADGVTFFRYYRGVARWATIPPIGFHRFHRYDLVGHQMLASDQAGRVRSVIDAATEALRRGHSVFIVGSLQMTPDSAEPEALPAARLPFQPLGELPYSRQWTRMVGYFLQRHSAYLATVPVPAELPINGYEHPQVHVARGWRE